MNDVTALMGKLKANVAYLQFSDTSEERSFAPKPAAGSLLNRYAPPAAQPAPAVDASRVLADIFARLAR